MYLIFKCLREWAEEGLREKQNPKQVTRCQWRAWWGSNSRSVRSWPELKSRIRPLTNWATQVPQTILVFRWTVFIFFNYYFFFQFIYLWERECGWGRGREKDERESQTGSTLLAQSPIWGLNSWIIEIMTWAEAKSWMFNRLSRGAPRLTILIINIKFFFF